MFKDMKKRAAKTVKKHYWILLFLCLIGALFGTEYRDSTIALNSRDGVDEVSSQLVSTMNKNSIIYDLFTGDITGANELAQENLNALQNEETGSDTVFGHTQGILASVVNEFSSGMFFVKIAQGVYTVIRSRDAATLLIIVFGLLGYAFIWIFITNFIQVIIQRYFMEARTYEHLSIRTATYFYTTKTWRKAAITMMRKSLYNLLWLFTIVGYFPKHYSYYLVNPIVAENPDLDWKRSIQLSKNMMYGHKMEAFKLELSMIGWQLLGVITGGISSLFWFNSYATAVRTEYYVERRKEAQEKQLDDSIMLNDEYLYAFAPEEVMNVAYGDIIKEQEYAREHAIPLTKTQKFFADNFGIWIGSIHSKREYQEIHGREAQAEKDLEAMHHAVYPLRLAPLYVPEKKQDITRMTWNRVYTAWSLVAIFFAVSFIGWVWEVLLTMVTQGVFVNRGTLLGPWLPIYGSGAVLALTLLAKFRHQQIKTFFMAMVMSGIVEYTASYVLEVMFAQRWWDYTGYFLTLNGRICAEGLFVFGIGCVAIIYLIAPIIDDRLSRINSKYIVPVLSVLLVLFGADVVHSATDPNMGPGITDNNAGTKAESAGNINTEIIYM